MHQINICLWSLHPTEKVCKACIPLINPESAQKSHNLIIPRSCSSSRSQCPATSTHSSCANEGGNDVLQDILKKLESNSKQLAAIYTKLEPIKQIPAILARVEASKKDIAEIKINQDTLRQEMDERKSAREQGNKANAERVECLEKLNGNLASQVQALLLQRNEETDAIIIGGIKADNITAIDWQQFNFAVLKSISPDLATYLFC